MGSRSGGNLDAAAGQAVLIHGAWRGRVARLLTCGALGRGSGIRAAVGTAIGTAVGRAFRWERVLAQAVLARLALVGASGLLRARMAIHRIGCRLLGASRSEENGDRHPGRKRNRAAAEAVAAVG